MSEYTPPAEKKDAFAFKSTRLDLIAFQPMTSDLAAIDRLLQKKLGGQENVLSHEALLIDLQQVQEPNFDLAALLELMHQFNLLPIAVRHANLAQQHIATTYQLAVLNDEKIKTETILTPAHETALIITRPVRTGQQVYAKNRDLIVLSLVSAGAEIIADGSIHVYAPLRGRALAGVSGNTEARIFTSCMQAELLSIAGVYRNIEETLPESLCEKGVQVFLEKKKLVIEALQF